MAFKVDDSGVAMIRGPAEAAEAAQVAQVQ